MIVTCAECSKRYMLDDVLVPKDGRQVRCVSCQHIWWQMPAMSSVANTSAFLDLSQGEETIEPSFSQNRFRSVGLVLCLALFFSFVSCLVFGRNMIVGFCPASERAYALFGLPISLPGAGLMVSNMTSISLQEGASEMVVVAGDVTNTSDRVRELSPLKIKIIGNLSPDKGGERYVLDSWGHQFSETLLLPGEHIHFETAPRPKIEGMQYVDSEF